MLNLIPKDDVFFDLFDKAAANAHECTKALAEFLEHYDDLEGRMRRIKALAEFLEHYDDLEGRMRRIKSSIRRDRPRGMKLGRYVARRHVTRRMTPRVGIEVGRNVVPRARNQVGPGALRAPRTVAKGRKTWEHG